MLTATTGPANDPAPVPGIGPQALLEAAGASCGGPDDLGAVPALDALEREYGGRAARGRLTWAVVDGLAGAFLSAEQVSERHPIRLPAAMSVRLTGPG